MTADVEIDVDLDLLESEIIESFAGGANLWQLGRLPVGASPTPTTCSTSTRTSESAD